jgi:amidase
LAGDGEFEVVFDRIRSYCPFTPVYNVTGAPAIALPLGKSTAGLPIGVQFAAAHGQDRLLLELALALEEAQPWNATAPAWRERSAKGGRR